MPTCLQVLTTARVTGRQTIYRAELFAVLKLCEWFQKICVHVDSQAVLDAIVRCRKAMCPEQLQADADFDLIERLWHALRRGDFRFLKVRAHQDAMAMSDWREVYDTLGNQCANDAAITANRYMYTAQAKVWDAMGRDVARSFDQLRRVYSLHLELHKARVMLEQQNRVLEPHGLEAAVPDAQRDLLANWQVSEVWEMPGIQVDFTSRSVMGPKLSRLFVQWAQQVKWPAEHLLVPDDPGVTYVELAMSFMLFSKSYLPVRRYRADGSAFLWLASGVTEASENGVCISELGWTMSYWLHQLAQLTFPGYLPGIEAGNCRSLYRLGARNHSKGLVRRPELPFQRELIAQLSTLSLQFGAALPQQCVEVDVAIDIGQFRLELQDNLLTKQTRVKKEVQQVRQLTKHL
eukprot:Skav213314  [mRNA]  locus=scaffold1383:152342:153556:+ [translate_table: standard]